jgi:hypothetical protein
MTTKATPVATVERDAKGRVRGGALNPGGLTKEQREARDLMNAALFDEPTRKAWKAGYLQALAEANPIILKDYADRTLGKPTERILHGEDPENPFDTTPALTQDERRALLKVQLAAEAKK